MSLSAGKSLTLTLLVTAVWKAESAPTPEVTLSEIHEGIRAMRGAYFEGDILMEGYPETGRTATSDGNRLWPEGVIPYTTDSTLGTSPNIDIIRNAMDWIENKTCLRFVSRDDQKDYVRIASKQGCYSYLGRNGGEQPLSLGRGCLYNGTVTHELLHAVGFYHEHTRPDRDDYVNIFIDNVVRAFRFNFKKVKPSDIRLLTPFDYDSVMLYGSDSFSRSSCCPTMLTKNGSRLIDVYEKAGLSSSDIIRINTLYNCPQ